MGKLYSVCLISRTQMRDMRLDSILNDGVFNSDTYIHNGDFTYIFELNNTLSSDITKNTLVYKTLGGALRLKNKLSDDWVMKLRYAVRGDDGSWIRNLKNDDNHEIVIIDITEKWDSLIDSRIEIKRQLFEKEVSRLKSKKSK